jgi:hypothetical protein
VVTSFSVAYATLVLYATGHLDSSRSLPQEYRSISFVAQPPFTLPTEPTARGPRTLVISIASRYNVMLTSGISAREYQPTRNCATAPDDFSAVQTK